MIRTARRGLAGGSAAGVGYHRITTHRAAYSQRMADAPQVNEKAEPRGIVMAAGVGSKLLALGAKPANRVLPVYLECGDLSPLCDTGRQSGDKSPHSKG